MSADRGKSSAFTRLGGILGVGRASRTSAADGGTPVGGSKNSVESNSDNSRYSIELRDIHKEFDGAKVLRGIDLCVKEGSITTILGPSGTGKSVLLKHMTGVLPPDRGEVIVNGENLWDLTPKARRERSTRMGVLFQDGGMIGSLNIYDNAALPLRYHTEMSEPEIKSIVLDRLTSVGLEDSLSKLPGEVSGGMRKRAAFARALVMDPSIVFFDEPDSGLDPIRTNLLNELILKMHREHQATYVLVTHYVATARHVSDYIALIWQGRVVVHGPAEEVFESDDPVVRQFLTGDIAGPVGMK